MDIQVEKLRQTLKKEQKKVVFLVALVAVFLYVWIPLMKSSDNSAARVPAGRVAAAPQNPGPRSANPANDQADGFESSPYPAFLSRPLPAALLPRNPFVTLPGEAAVVEPDLAASGKTAEEAQRAAEAARAERMAVASIMLFGGTPSCVVDGVVLVRGSEYNGFTVQAIQEDAVVFDGEFGEYRISVRQQLKFGN